MKAKRYLEDKQAISFTLFSSVVWDELLKLRTDIPMVKVVSLLAKSAIFIIDLLKYVKQSNMYKRKKLLEQMLRLFYSNFAG